MHLILVKINFRKHLYLINLYYYELFKHFSYVNLLYEYHF